MPRARPNEDHDRVLAQGRGDQAFVSREALQHQARRVLGVVHGCGTPSLLWRSTSRWMVLVVIATGVIPRARTASGPGAARCVSAQTATDKGLGREPPRNRSSLSNNEWCCDHRENPANAYRNGLIVCVALVSAGVLSLPCPSTSNLYQTRGSHDALIRAA